MDEKFLSPKPMVRVPMSWRHSGFVPVAAKATDLLLLITLALAVFLLGSLAWPLYPGRDAQTYLMYFLDLGSSKPVFPLLMLFRTPIAPVFYGSLLDAGGSTLAEAANGLCFVLAVVSFYLVGCHWSRRIGLATAVVLCLYPGYGALYHHVSSDGLFGTGIALLAVLICGTAAAPTTRKFALLGLAVFLLTMIRPSGLIFLGSAALIPFLMSGEIALKVRNAAVVVAVGTVLVSGWATYNKVRYGDFTLSRLAPLNMPLFRLLTMDRLVRPENGPASLELARAIQSDLLQKEPYRSYGVTLEDFLGTGRIRMWSDLAGLSDRTWGWTSDYEKLRAVSRQAILSHPGAYTWAVAKTTVKLLFVGYVPPSPAWPPPPRTILCELGCFREGSMMINGKELPLLFEPGDVIPIGNSYWLASTPDNSITTDWTTLVQPRFRFRNSSEQARFDSLSEKLNSFMKQLPSREPMGGVSYYLNSVTKLFPSMPIWLLVGMVGLALRPERNLRLLVCLCASAVVFVFVTSLGLPSTAEYRVPMDPLIILFGAAGLIGRGGLRSREAEHR